jgi:DNA-binding HxlR family transcriptional regulator
MKNQYNLPCNIAHTLNIIGDKWTLLILYRIFLGCETYKDIQNELEGIPTNLLSKRLKTMESDELITRKLYQIHPPRYKYTLTVKGMDLSNVFNSLIMWGEKYLNKSFKYLVHSSCKCKVEHKYYCPRCNKYIDSSKLEIIDSNELKGNKND